MALASANLHTGRYEGMCPQTNLAFSLEESSGFFTLGMYTASKNEFSQCDRLKCPSEILQMILVSTARGIKLWAALPGPQQL